mgnify:CR=1 FL=1
MTFIPEVFYIVADHGRLGRETIINWEACTKQDAIDRLGEYDKPIAVQSIDREGNRWSDVSEDIALDILHNILNECGDLPTGGVRAFIELHAPEALDKLETERAGVHTDREEHHTHWGQP